RRHESVEKGRDRGIVRAERAGQSAGEERLTEARERVLAFEELRGVPRFGIAQSVEDVERERSRAELAKLVVDAPRARRLAQRPTKVRHRVFDLLTIHGMARVLRGLEAEEAERRQVRLRLAAHPQGEATLLRLVPTDLGDARANEVLQVGT